MGFIRELQEEDFEQFIPVINAFTRFPQTIERKRFEQWLEAMPNGCHTFVYVEEGAVIGTARALIEPKFSNNLSFMGHVEDVAVLPEHRGKGVARSLVDHIVEFCWNAGCYKIVLECSESLVPLYERSGFRPKGLGMSQYRNP